MSRKIKEELYNGKTFGGLKILNKEYNSDNRNYFRCECLNCKKQIVAELWNIIGEHYKSCGCLRFAINTKSPRWKGYGDISRTVFNNIKCNAKIRNLEFNLTIEYLWDLFLKQDKKCALSGLDLSFPQSRIDYIATASLDRVDSSIGYREGNVQWVHKDVNFMKQDFKQEKFLDYCKKITEYKKI